MFVGNLGEMGVSYDRIRYFWEDYVEYWRGFNNRMDRKWRGGWWWLKVNRCCEERLKMLFCVKYIIYSVKCGIEDLDW